MPEPVRIKLTMLDPQLPMPTFARPGDAGADLAISADLTLAPAQRAVVGTGVAISLPEGYAAFIHPRSGLAARHGLTLVNAPGTIDAGYRGEIKLTLLNTDRAEPIVLHRGDRVAQLVVQRVESVQFDLVDELPDSDRGVQGFGSSGGWAGAADDAD